MNHFRLLAASAILLVGTAAEAYPLDGFPTSGIRRLELVRLRVEGALPGTAPPPGGRRPLSDVHLRLTAGAGVPLDALPAPDEALQARLDALFPNRDESYSVSLLDITPGRPLRCAGRQQDRTFSPGSVGKIAVASGLFAELARRFPDDLEARGRLLQERMVTADHWIGKDRHPIPFFDLADSAFVSRPTRAGDVFSLLEWADHMMSASANSAASTVWKEVMLMRALGDAYPPTPEAEAAFFRDTAPARLQSIALEVVNGPLRAAGISKADFQMGSFFTNTGQRIVPGAPSYISSQGALLFLLRLEQGRLVDAWSSLQIKRLMYTTGRRIRYVSSPALTRAAVYFKSGSLFACQPEEGFRCGAYMGNIHNYMNSVAIVEHPDGGPVYLVALMSNVLRKNSAVDHQSLATQVDAALRQ